MNRAEFEALRDLADKQIVHDIVLTEKGPVLEGKAKVESEIYPNPIQVDITLVPDVPTFIVNFSVDTIGAVCRFCLGGQAHRNPDTGEWTTYHKHSLRMESCPNNRLPHIVEITDLPLETLGYEAVWRMICKRANIIHHGDILLP